MWRYTMSSLLILGGALLFCCCATRTRAAVEKRGSVAGLGGVDCRVPSEAIEGRPAGLGAGEYYRELRVGGRKRYYELHVPARYKGMPMPLVLVQHGGSGCPATIRYESKMDDTADREGFIVCYPAGTSQRLIMTDRLLLWNDGRPFEDGSMSPVDDVAFITAVLNDVESLFKIDTTRVYACGFSNGAQFTYRLGKQLSHRIAAIATVAGQRLVTDVIPAPSRPLAVMQFSGLKDVVGPYNGGKPQNVKADLKTDLASIPDVIKSWVKFNQCPANPAETKRIGKAVMTRYGPGSDGVEVILWTLEDGGHTWPGGRMVPSSVKQGLGNINRDILASDLMWQFFERHPLKKAPATDKK